MAHDGVNAAVSYEFGPFRLEPATRRLLRDGDPLPLTPKAFDFLLLLVQNRERVVEKEEVLRLLWPDTVVEESNLAQNVFTLRKALGDSPEGARFIATVPRRGYRFVAEVTTVGNGAAADATATVAPAPRRGPRQRLRRPALLGLGAVALVWTAYVLGRQSAPEPPEPKLTRLTFRRGTARVARFAGDGRSVVYSAAWDGGLSYVFMARPESPESMPLELPSADVFAVSRRGDLALALGPTPLTERMGDFRTLARVPLTGGTPRDLLEHVEAADWAPDGENLAVVRKVDNAIKRLEYPIGRVLRETTASQCLQRPRVSPDGDRVAVLECLQPGFVISVVDRQGGRRQAYRSESWISGHAWSPRGDEVWLTTQSAQGTPELRAAGLDGRARLLARLPGELLDVSPEGRVLVTVGQRRAGIMARAAGAATERELSWLEGSSAIALSADGRHVLFGEMMEGGGVAGRIYLRRTDGSPAVRLGDGFPIGLSPDGRWALVRRHGSPGIKLHPTGAGEFRHIETGDVSMYHARWFNDGRRVLLGGMSPGREGRLFVLELDGGALRPITPEATGVGVVSPDGGWVATIGHDGHFLYPVEGGERRPLPGFRPDEWPLEWSADGRWIYARSEGELPARIFRVEVATGRREQWKELMPADSTGIVWIGPLVTPDGRAYAYTYHRLLSDLYLVEGLK